MLDYKLALMCGTPLPFPPLSTSIHQPVIKEIGMIGEKTFFLGSQYLCLNKNTINQDNSVLLNKTNFQIFMEVMSHKEAKDKKEAATQVLTLLFPDNKPVFTPNSILLMGKGESKMIDADNFDEFQDVIKLIFCVKEGEQNSQNFNPANKKAQEIAQKLLKGRDKVAEINGQKEISILAQYISMLTVGLSSMSLQDLTNCTLFQLYDLVERYQLYLNWDIDIKSRLAGGKPDKPPDNWMKNIH